MCFTLDMLPYGNEDKTPQTCLRQASSPTLQGSQRLAAIRRKTATNASDSEHRAPGRAWANAKHVWGADCRWQSLSADRVGRQDEGATAYKCEGVTNRNTKHKRRVVTRRQ